MVTLKAVVSLLNNASPVTDLVGDRILPNFIPEKIKTYPLVVLYTEDAEINSTMSGPSALAYQMVKVICLARTYSQMVDVGTAVMGALMYQQGTFGGLQVRKIYYAGENESEIEAAGLGENDLLHQKELSFKVWFYVPSLIDG